LIDEIRLLEVRIQELEKQLGELARQSLPCTTLLSIPGAGLLTATAMVATTSREVGHFKDARHFTAWFGLTPKEHSSGNTRKLGRISKRGDAYVRMLLTHGARSVVIAAANRSHKSKSRCAAGSAAAMGAGSGGDSSSRSLAQRRGRGVRHP
jgi:transposase